MGSRKPSRTAWKPGKSGNPKGRPPGTGEVAKLRASIREQLPGILKALTAQALAGDSQAARLLLERVLPPLRPVEQGQPLALPDGTLTEQGRAVLAAIGAGDIGPGQGAQLLGAIAGLARLVELDDIDRRLTKLKSATEPKGNHHE